MRWMQVARRAGATGEKYLGCCGLAHDLGLSLIFGIFTCGFIHIFTEVDSVWLHGELFCSAHALNVFTVPAFSWHIGNPCAPQHSSVLSTQQIQRLLRSCMKVPTMLMSAMHVDLAFNRLIINQLILPLLHGIALFVEWAATPEFLSHYQSLSICICFRIATTCKVKHFASLDCVVHFDCSLWFMLKMRAVNIFLAESQTGLAKGTS